MESKPLKIKLDNGKVVEGIINFSLNLPWRIKLIAPTLRESEFVNSDLFECLVNLRQELAKQGYFLLCQGSRIDVYPSRMSRDMGGGRQAYVLQLGKQATLNDLVDIFDYAEPSLIGTVDEQKNYYNCWSESLR